ncbi:uncharacterized protein LOC119672141 [Teleopsis dalmanni]|uniref:uncharacterized protein LOC119672141 n=1 Tax=Teleopsis dalmanni TaxID=139649 RepID=UPI0018CF9BB8|nr:uncharacterized protein LOC119672141 [Teleopsis dalmanni]
MAKILCILFVALVFAVALNEAEPQRARSSRITRPRTRYLARQEAAADAAAVTPYPSADELKPDVPFDEAAAPPAVQTPDEVYGPPETTYNAPDEVYGPPEVSDNGLPAADPAAEDFPAPLDPQQARLVAARRANLRQRQLAYRQANVARAARPAKLKAAVRRTA